MKAINLKPLKWFIIIIGFIILTIIVTYLIPTDPDVLSVSAIPKYVFAFIFIAFLPGYCLVNILFTGKNRIDLVETLVLSVALSFGIAGLDGLFLGLSPIGIGPGPTKIAVSLSIIVLALATIAFVRKNRELHQMQVPQQVSA